MLPSCKKIIKLTNFYTSYTDSLSINPSTLTESEYNIWTFRIHNNGEDLYAVNHSNYESTQSIKMNRTSLSIVLPDTATLNFIESIEVNISSAGLNEQRVAWLDELKPENLASINLEVFPDDIMNYVLDKDYLLHVNIKSRSNIDINYDIILTYSFFISTKLTDI